MANINQDLLYLAQWRIDQVNDQEKRAFQPPIDPSQDPSGGGGGAPPGGAPPMDPSQGGGAPPMDPSMGGGAPPMDPSQGGGPVPGGGGLTADSIQQMITQGIQQAMSQQGGGMAGGGAGAAGGMGKPMKADINTVAMDIFQVKKLIMGMYNAQGMPLPPDILDGPNRDPSTGAMMPPGAPGSTSDPAQMQQAAQQQPAGGGAGGQQGGSIPAVQPIQPGGPGVDGAAKQGADASLYMGEPSNLSGFEKLVSRSTALHSICRRINK